MARLTSILFLAAAALPFAAATSCGSNEFLFNERSCCLPKGGQPNPPSPPSGVSCPTNGWYWHTENECCVPHNEPTPSTPPPQCESSCEWSQNDLKCYPKPSAPSTPPSSPPSNQCSPGEFFFGARSCCLPNGGPPNPPSPPSGVSCPTNGWSWHSENECCVPHQPQTPSSPPPQCESSCIWSQTDLKCYPQPRSPPSSPPPSSPPPSSPPSSPPSQCNDGEFFFGERSCCLPHGTPPNPPSPPSGRTCPVTWYWHDDKNCCVPSSPPSNSPPPQCQKGCGWDDTNLWCFPLPTPPSPPPPKPSGYWKRHVMKSRAVTLCPQPLEACPIKGLMASNGDYECLDTTVELTSCGGCASTGAGQDCTAITGAWNVACENSHCKVYTCSEGYKVARNGKSCIEL